MINPWRSGPVDSFTAQRAAAFFVGTTVAALAVGSMSAADRRAAVQMMKTVLADRRQASPRYEGLSDYLSRAGYVADSPYLRLGKPPPEGRSATYFEDGENTFMGHNLTMKAQEEGISVFDGKLTRDGHFILEITNELHWRLLVLLVGENRPAYLVYGPRRGVGGEGEPLLSRVDGVRPVPGRCIVASTPHPSYSLETWNEARGGPLEDRPELAGFFGRGAR